MYFFTFEIKGHKQQILFHHPPVHLLTIIISLIFFFLLFVFKFFLDTQKMLFIVSGLLLSSVFASLNGSPVRVERSDPDPTANTTTGTTDLSELSDFDLEHTMAINQQNSIINTGQIVSNAITNAITRPFTYINNQVSSAVSTLPGIFAANGAGNVRYKIRFICTNL